MNRTTDQFNIIPFLCTKHCTSSYIKVVPTCFGHHVWSSSRCTCHTSFMHSTRVRLRNTHRGHVRELHLQFDCKWRCWRCLQAGSLRTLLYAFPLYIGADKSLARPGTKEANVSVRMAWISFGVLPRRKKKTWRHLASQCCWNRARSWHASELVSFLVGLRTYQHPVLILPALFTC